MDLNPLFSSQRAEQNTAEILFDQIRHSTPSHDSGQTHTLIVLVQSLQSNNHLNEQVYRIVVIKNRVSVKMLYVIRSLLVVQVL